MIRQTTLQARSELRKVGSLRSTYVTVALAVTVAVVIGYLVANMRSNDWQSMTPSERSDVDPIEDSLLGVYIVQILIGSLGVLVASSEYATKTMSGTLLASPNRLRVLVAKVLVVSAMIGLTSLIVVSTALLVGIPLSPGPTPPLSTIFRVAVGTVISLVGVALFGLFLGFLTRSTAAAIGILLAIMVLPAVVVFAPEYTTYLPARVGQALMLTESSPASHLLSPAVALCVLIGYILGLAAASMIALDRRDA